MNIALCTGIVLHIANTQTDRDRHRQRDTDRQTQTDRHRQTDRQRQRQTERETDRQRERQTDRQRDDRQTKKNFKNVIFVFSALNYTCWYDLF